MLDTKVIDTVKSTAPILQKEGEVLTRHFYKRMFKHNPEVLPLFNLVNQAQGVQQKTLAAAICAYAANIDNLGALGNAVELIANKHASLGIKSEHYSIVGENLLKSIKEVLGDAATDDIIEAWSKAYFFLADILIGREKQIYDGQESVLGGWRGFKKFIVAKKVRESDVITSFYLKPEDGSMPPIFKPGQYITIRAPFSYSETTMRNYSLSDKPGQEHFRISVKREDGMNGSPKGYVSNMLHSKVEEGQFIEVAPPCGEFFFDLKAKQERPLVLLAAGVGITPILSILISALEKAPKRNIVFIQASLHEKNQAFKNTIDKLAQNHHNFIRHYRYSDSVPDGIKCSTADYVSEGLVDAELIKSMVNTSDAEFYFCGPKPFMINVYQTLRAWMVPEDQIHFEFFGPRQEIEISPEKAL